MTEITVMVIDDDEDIREILSEILVSESYTVITAKNGAEALELLKVTTPSLILLDLNMPFMDGIAFRRVQLADPTTSRIPTIVMSAIYQMSERIAGLGFDDALAKPVKLRELLDVVERYGGTIG